jgi:hypothetical protein
VAGEAEQYLGMSMTYSLFEYVKENMDNLLEEQPDQIFDTKVSDNLSKLDIQEGILLYSTNTECSNLFIVNVRYPETFNIRTHLCPDIECCPVFEWSLS